jgi:hypothetical protein
VIRAGDVAIPVPRTVGAELRALGIEVPECFRPVEHEAVPEVIHAQPPPEPEKKVERWARWGIGDRVLDLVRRDEFRDTQAVRQARDLVRATQRGRSWAALCGPKGAGKTVASAVWLDELRLRRAGPRLYLSSEAIAALPPGTVFAEERIEAAIAAAALVLDDLGVADVGKDGRLHEHCARILRGRYDRGAPVLWNTILSVDDAVTYLGNSVMASRWREVGAPRVVTEIVRPDDGGRG